MRRRETSSRMASGRAWAGRAAVLVSDRISAFRKRDDTMFGAQNIRGKLEEPDRRESLSHTRI